jgi:dTMP kinase
MIIALEGSDQAGKKTQTAMLSKALKAQKIKTEVFDFPDYSTIIGKEINNYLHGKRKFPPEIIHYLYAANRWEKLEEIKKSAAKNSILIMNRYYHSNLVYGIANGLKEKWLQSIEDGLPKADLVIVLDVSQNESFSRKKSKRDKFEKDKEFSKKISQIYRRLAKKHRWKLIDASGTKQETHQEILKIIFKKIGS